MFKPIGLDNAGVVSALIVGVMAKELVVSSISITNAVTSKKALISSLLASTSVVYFSKANAVSFLIFVLLYCPCISNIAVLKNEAGKFWAMFSVISQFTIAYMLSFIVYTALTKGVLFSLMVAVVMILIVCALISTIKKLKRSKCSICRRCRN